MRCLAEVKFTFDAGDNGGVKGLPGLATYPTALWASVQVQLGALRFTEDTVDPTSTTGELVTCSDTANPPRIWFESYYGTGLPLANVKMISPGNNTIIIVKYFTKE